MPPRYKFTREQIVAAGLAITREQGLGAMTARAVASRLGASPKVIFGTFSGMEELERQVIQAAHAFYWNYTENAMKENRYPAYKAAGMAYIAFSRQEPKLFSLLFMEPGRENALPESQRREAVQPIIDMICKNTGLSQERAYTFHLELWIFVHGMAAMIATGSLRWEEEFVSRVLTDAYQGLRKQFCQEE